MAFTLGQIYQTASSSDPSLIGGFTGAGNIWYQTDTGLLLIRNTSNAWTTIGSGEQALLGLFSLSGGALSAAVTGSTQMTSDGLTAFAKPPEVLSNNSILASIADLNAIQVNLINLIRTDANQYISSVAAPGLTANIDFKFGQLTSATLTPTQTLNLPFSGMAYQDGTAVQLADCIGFASFAATGNPSGSNMTMYCKMIDTKGMQWQVYTTDNATVYSLLNYMIIAIKQSA